MRVEWTREARDSLFEVTEYIRKENPEVAKKVITKIHESTAKLAAFPFAAPISEDFPSFRELTIARYPFVVWYRVKEDQDIVEINLVWHGAQNRF